MHFASIVCYNEELKSVLKASAEKKHTKKYLTLIKHGMKCLCFVIKFTPAAHDINIPLRIAWTQQI